MPTGLANPLLAAICSPTGAVGGGEKNNSLSARQRWESGLSMLTSASVCATQQGPKCLLSNGDSARWDRGPAYRLDRWATRARESARSVLGLPTPEEADKLKRIKRTLCRLSYLIDSLSALSIVGPRRLLSISLSLPSSPFPSFSSPPCSPFSSSSSSSSSAFRANRIEVDCSRGPDPKKGRKGENHAYTTNKKRKKSPSSESQQANQEF